MSLTIYHHSRSEEYRRPLGARAAGEEVLLRLRVDGDGAREVVLRLWWMGGEIRHAMSEAAPGLYEYSLALPDAPGLLWYYFIVYAGDGSALFYGNRPDCLGGEGQIWDHEPPSFQLTVYDPAFSPPDWMGDGILYQIMPDRFFAEKKKKPPRGWLHENWHEPPALSIDPDTGDNRADDFFGGNLAGIEKKLPYLKGLGITALYLNPIFESPSNHKYNTGDYRKIDPSFGTEKDFVRLCEKAKELGVRLILDGVFSHTGSDSRYFNREGRYGPGGAYQNPRSPYSSWYRFERWPEKYDCWWGFPTLPNVNEMDPGYLRFIVTGKDAVAPMWLKKGASGWRLDVADELPMDFIRLLRRAVKAENPDACLLGEVWEDASNKEAYGQVRSYCLGDTLDGVMNYPLREGVIDFLTGKLSAPDFKRRLDALYENYPAPFARSLMNLLGSHDKARAINRLSGAAPENTPRNQRTAQPLTAEQYALGRARYIQAWRFICSLPGMPCLYYGDEAGAQGEDDPFCRGPYPWGREDEGLIAEIAEINRARLENEALRRGEVEFIAPDDDVLIVRRRLPGREEYEYRLCRT